MIKVYYRRIPAYFYPEDNNKVVGANSFYDIVLKLFRWWDKTALKDPQNHFKPDLEEEKALNKK